MKRAALLLGLAGCNWVYGLDATKPAPDAPDAPVVVPGVPETIAFLQLPAAGAQPVDAEIPDLTVQASTLEGDQQATLVIEAGGLVHVPFDLTTGMWRLDWQRAGGPVHEVQNPPQNSHLVEALYGPVTRAAPAQGAGYTVTSAGYPGTLHHANYRLFTTGVWTEGSRAGGGSGDPLTHDLLMSTAIASGMGVPRPGDKGALVDYDIAAGCRTATGSVVFDAGASGPPEAAVGGTWVQNAGGVTVSTPLDSLDTTRVSPFGEMRQTAHEDIGLLASASMPAFARPPDTTLAALRWLPGPVMLSLRRCDLPYQSSAPPVHTPVDLGVLPRVAAVEVVATRTVDGAPAINGISMIASEGANQTFDVTTRVAVASGATLMGVDLWGAADDVPVSASAPTLQLTWSIAQDKGTADYWDVALLEVTSGGMVEKKIYTTTKRELAIDRDDLEAGKAHVLRFTAYTGRSAAAIGDFRTITGDQQISIVHSRSFVP